MTISTKPGSDGDFPYSYTSHGQQTDRWAYPDPADWAALLATPTNLMPIDDDGIDVPEGLRELIAAGLVGRDGSCDVPLFTAGATSWDDLLTEEMRDLCERDELDRVAVVGDDGRDADGELMAERAEPHTRKVA